MAHKGGITIRYLKEIFCSARLYVRPLQFDILETDLDLPEDIKQKDEDERSCQVALYVLTIRSYPCIILSVTYVLSSYVVL